MQHHGSGDEVSREGGEVIIGRADVKSKQKHQETVEVFEITQHGDDVHQPVSGSRDQTSRIPIKVSSVYCIYGGTGRYNYNCVYVMVSLSFQFPKRPEMMLGADEIKRRIAQLETYLNAALQYEEYRNHSAMVIIVQMYSCST